MIIEVFFLFACTAVGLAHGGPQCGSSIVATNYYSAPVCTSSSVIPIRFGCTTKGLPCPCSDGPQTPPLPILHAPGITLPAVQSPIIALPSPPIPAPRVLCEKCICTKTVVKPQIIQRQVTVPKIQRYLKRTYTPVIERIAYTTRPRTCWNGNDRNCCCGCRKYLYSSDGGYCSDVC